jgi:hypothetical protein
VEEEEVKKNLARHDGGRMLAEKYLSIHHSRELQVENIHEGEQGYPKHARAGREASLA